MRRRTLTGLKFGRLKVLRESGPLNCECICDCGKLTTTTRGRLNSGKTRSCGCLRNELVAARNVKRQTTHGKTHTVEYKIWDSMVQRCTNPKDTGYAGYGGRGIKICHQWLTEFMVFLSDMGPRPSSTHSLDRVDNNGNYEPGNVRWATRKEQERNKRNNHLITIGSTTKCLSAWAEETGIEFNALSQRLRRGWTAEEAVFTPVKVYRKRKK